MQNCDTHEIQRSWLEVSLFVALLPLWSLIQSEGNEWAWFSGNTRGTVLQTAQRPGEIFIHSRLFLFLGEIDEREIHGGLRDVENSDVYDIV